MDKKGSINQLSTLLEEIGASKLEAGHLSVIMRLTLTLLNVLISDLVITYIYSVTTTRIISSHSHLIHNCIICWSGGGKTFHFKSACVYTNDWLLPLKSYFDLTLFLWLKQDALSHSLRYPYKVLIYTFLKVMIWLRVHWQACKLLLIERNMDCVSTKGEWKTSLFF